MLSALLPGLREIRAPLAAGYLWLVVGWLLVHDRIATGSSAHGAVDALSDLRHAIGVGGIGAAATFMAYLLGALWEPIAIRIAGALWSVASRIPYAIIEVRFASGPRPHPLRLWFVRTLSRLRHPVDRYGEDVAHPVRWWFRRALDKLRRAGDSRGFPPRDPSLRDRLTKDLSRAVEPRLTPYDPPREARISFAGWNRLWLVGERLFSEVDEVLMIGLGSPVKPVEPFLDDVRPLADEWMERYARARFADPDNAPARDEAIADLREVSTALEMLEFTSPRDSWWLRETRDFAQNMYPGALSFRLAKPLGDWRPVVVLEKNSGQENFALLGEPDVTARLFDELPLTARKLVGEQQELLLEANRMRGEIEFRDALAIPVAVAASVFAFGLGLPTWGWLVASIAGVLAGWALLADGWRRDSLRNEFLVELLAIGKAKSPTFERLLERARQTKGGQPGPTDEAQAAQAII